MPEFEADGQNGGYKNKNDKGPILKEFAQPVNFKNLV